MPPYAENPFAGLGGKRFRIEDAKPVFVFESATELAFFKAAADWAFPIHFTLAKTGIRPGELSHLLVEDVDLNGGWIQICNKYELGWRIKTGRERSIPLVDELVAVLRIVIGSRTTGVVFRREKFCDSVCPLANMSRRALAAALERRIAAEDASAATTVSRARQAQILPKTTSTKPRNPDASNCPTHSRVDVQRRASIRMVPWVKGSYIWCKNWSAFPGI